VPSYTLWHAIELGDSRRTLDAWRHDYNSVRPHSALNNIPPVLYRTDGDFISDSSQGVCYRPWTTLSQAELPFFEIGASWLAKVQSEHNRGERESPWFSTIASNQRGALRQKRSTGHGGTTPP
jgi:hypothetical protein